MISEETLNNLVGQITKKQFSIQNLHIQGSTVNFSSSDANTELDKKRELNGIITEFVVNEFAKSQEQNLKFLKLVYGTFDAALKKYGKEKNLDEKQLFIVYKGGNILRIIAYEVFDNLCGKSVQVLKKYYADSFKKSDADFSIYIDPKLPNFAEIYDDMINLSYLLQTEIRKVFTDDLTEYFEYYRFSYNGKKKLLEKYLNKLNETSTVKEKKYGFDTFKSLVLQNVSSGEDNKYTPKMDYEIDYQSGNPSDRYMVSLAPSGTNEIFISANKTLKFLRGDGTYASFALVRSKVSLNAFYGDKMTDVNGELIDVSIINQDNDGIHHFFEHLEDNISQFTIGSDSDVFVIRSYSLGYLLEDLEHILFDYSLSPWDDVKYAKRLKRILFIYFIILMTKNKMSNDNRIKYFQIVKANIFDKLKEGKKDEALKNIKYFMERLDKDMKTRGKTVVHYAFYNLLENLQKILTRDAGARGKLEQLFGKEVTDEKLKGLITELNTKLAELDQKKLDEYVSTIIENINVIVSALQELEEYRKNPTIEEGTLFDAQGIA